MSIECITIHKLANNLERHSFPFDEAKIPLNGIYILFQKGEEAHGQDRIVRIGTHNGNNQLRPRLRQHFFNENKDRSIFRKNIGRSLLNKHNDPFLKFWELDLTTRRAKDQYLSQINFNYQRTIEKKVSECIRDDFSFGVFEVATKEERLEIESKLISTVSWCDECKPSSKWLGNSSPKEKIVQSGLWLVNELYKTPFDASGIEHLSRFIES